jgi:hypothetical protein
MDTTVAGVAREGGEALSVAPLLPVSPPAAIPISSPQLACETRRWG